MMKKRMQSTHRKLDAQDIVFYKALEPLEAAVIPAGEKRRLGALAMVPRAYDAQPRRQDQRAKIWVR